MKNSTPLIVTLLSTILFSLLSYFGYSPDPSLSSDTIAYADQAAQAISTKNWIMLGTTLVSFIAVVYVWWKGRTAARAVNASLFIFALIATFLAYRSPSAVRQAHIPIPVSFESKTPGITIIVTRPLSRFIPIRRC